MKICVKRFSHIRKSYNATKNNFEDRIRSECNRDGPVEIVSAMLVEWWTIGIQEGNRNKM